MDELRLVTVSDVALTSCSHVAVNGYGRHVGGLLPVVSGGL